MPPPFVYLQVEYGTVLFSYILISFLSSFLIFFAYGVIYSLRLII